MAYVSCRIVNYCNKLISNTNFKRMFTVTSIHRKIFNVQDEKDFEERVLKSEIPVVIDFQATWCGPCKLLAPRLENVIGSKNEKVHLAKVDVDTQAELAMKYEVESVPHVVGFKNGKSHSTFIGLQDEDQINAFVDALIEK